MAQTVVQWLIIGLAVFVLLVVAVTLFLALVSPTPGPPGRRLLRWGRRQRGRRGGVR
jgi:hypothetical protein